jgi:hypothetical protein
VTGEQLEAFAEVRATFPGHAVDATEASDGSVWITVRGVSIGRGWNQELIDLSVKLLVTYPSTPPYPFYGPAGLGRTDGRTFSPTQSNNVDLGDGVARTQISLRIATQSTFDTRDETLGSRFVAVLTWLRNPR